MRLLAIALSALALATPAAAQNTVTSWSNPHYDVNGSTPGENPLCMMTSTFDFEGRSSVEFTLGWNGETAILILTSWDWSAVDDQEYDGFRYVFPQSGYTFSGGVTRGSVSGVLDKGFATAFSPDFLDRIAADNRLFVIREVADEEPMIVADLNLVGSGAAIAALRRCQAHVARREAARIERERQNDYIARDPFAD